ncbi:PepSY domain-containing protein [Isoptericola sp. NPDC019693]|uniref:PepSY domain-containing protein n=1 Tax=Isoptericola sp. NPDC019693 TaxID=3364009 RepID=UPI0037B85F28
MSNRTARRLTVPAALALTLGLTLTACADGSDAGDAPVDATTTSADESAPDDAATDDSTEDNTDDSTGAGDDDTAPQDRTTAGLKAIATAEKEAGGTAYAVDDPDRDNTWEVDVATGTTSVEVEVSADGTEVVRTQDDDLDADDRRALDAATVSITQAIERTVAESGGDLEDAELDEDDGRDHWSVTVLTDGTETDYRVGTQDGKVVQDRDED